MCFYPLVKPYVYADTLDVRQLDTTVVNCDIDRVVHFSALLSAVAEQNVARGLQVSPQSTWGKHFSTCAYKSF